jgi:hypothetical protein
MVDLRGNRQGVYPVQVTDQRQPTYFEKGAPSPDRIQYDEEIEETWVNSAEASEITGYNRQYLVRLAQRVFQQPEKERKQGPVKPLRY